MEAIKPHQIINYDAGIVLIDLHQQRKNNFRQYKSATLNTGQPHVNEEQNPQTTTRNIRFPNQMIEQVTYLLKQRVQEFLSLGHWACRRRLTSKAYTSIKSDEEWTYSSLKTGRM